VHTTDLDRLHAEFLRFAITERWKFYLTAELGWDEPTGAGLAFLQAKTEELAQHIEADPADALDWLTDPVQPFGEHLDAILNVDWIPSIFPNCRDAKLPFAELERGMRRIRQCTADRGAGPKSMTEAEIDNELRENAKRFRKSA
jgi:hypothetical protein